MRCACFCVCMCVCVCVRDSGLIPNDDVLICGLQTTVLSCAVVIVTLFTCPRTRTPVTFYVVVVSVAFCFSMPILAVFLHRDFITWLASYIYTDSTKVLRSTLCITLPYVRSVFSSISSIPKLPNSWKLWNWHLPWILAFGVNCCDFFYICWNFVFKSVNFWC